MRSSARQAGCAVTAAEKARIEELVAELSLARLDVDFTFVADDKVVLRLKELGDVRTGKILEVDGGAEASVWPG